MSDTMISCYKLFSDEFIELYGKKNYWVYFDNYIRLCELHSMSVVRFFCEQYGPERFAEFDEIYMGRYYHFRAFVRDRLSDELPVGLLKFVNWENVCDQFKNDYIYDYKSLAVLKIVD